MLSIVFTGPRQADALLVSVSGGPSTLGAAPQIVPAPLNEEIATDIQAVSSFLYRKMDCKGFVRFDYILTENELYFLELNSIPGMSAVSIIPKQAQAFGLTLRELFEMALEEALG